MEVARREEPQATAQIYENGVISLNREGTADTLDTSAGVFIDRSTNGITMGYMADNLSLSDTEIEAIVGNIRSFLENNSN